MRRAIPRLALLLLSLALVPLAGHAAPQRVTAINGVGLIDYHDRPELKIGTWVKYHVTGSSALGMSDDYMVTVVMAGEERFWGDDGFWIETLTEHAGSAPVAVATLMSYAIFQDSLAFPHMQYYIRKTAGEVDEQGNPVFQVAKRPPETLVNRNRKERDLHWYIDTLGTDSVHVTAGSYFCHKVRIRQAVGASVDQGDSTFYTEVREDRDSYVTLRVPLTRIVREDIDYTIRRKTWLIGRSQDAPENTMEHSVGRAELIGYGTGYKPGMVPERYQHTLKEQNRRAAAPAAAPRRKPGGKSTRKSG